MNSCPGLSVERRELVSWTETRISPNDIFVHYDPTRRTEGELYYLEMLIPLSICYRVTCYTDITPQHIPFMTPFITRDHYSLYYTIHRRNNQYNSFTSLTHQSLSSFIHPSSHRHRLLLLSLLCFIGGFYYWQFAFIFAFLLHILMVGYMSERSLFLQYYLYSIHHTLPAHGVTV